jgi:ketosteroid isomerase-like protein
VMWFPTPEEALEAGGLSAQATSRENVELVRQVYEQWGRGNFRAGAELYDPNVLLVLRPEFGPAASGRYCGPEEIAKYMRDEFLAEWTGAVIAGGEFLDAGDSVVVGVHQRATGRESGTPVEMRYFQVWTFRGGSVIRIESIMERADALEAVGLRE